MFVFFDFRGHGWPAIPWLRLSVSHPVRRCVAVAAATEVCLAVAVACPAHVGVILPMYGYALMQSAAHLQYQVHPIESWFHFALSSLGNHTNQQSDPCCMCS